jgi:ferredoxin-NADP reductase
MCQLWLESTATHVNCLDEARKTFPAKKGLDWISSFLCWEAGDSDTPLSFLQVCGDVKERAIFQCGPASMMNAVKAELKILGFPFLNLHQEDFSF